jgi:hypothetical protein
MSNGGRSIARFVLGVVGFCAGGFCGFWIGMMVAMALVPRARGIGEDMASFNGAVMGLIIGAIAGSYLATRLVRPQQ